VTLGVSVQQANLLTVADLNTTLRLALRSPNEPLRAEPAESIDFQDETPAPQRTAAPAPTPPPVVAAAPKKERPSVTIVDGDKLIEGSR
jgi:Flp pilus assembly protein CpaB